MDSLLPMRNGSIVVCADVYEVVGSRSNRCEGVVLAAWSDSQWVVWYVWKDDATNGWWEASGGAYFRDRLEASISFEIRRLNPVNAIPPANV